MWITMKTNSGFLAVAGEEAKKFLQGQLTCNMDDVTSSESHLGAHCNPEGRVISLFRIFLHNDQYYLHMPRDLVPIAKNALQKYAVFFKVILTDASDTPVKTSEPLMDISNGIPAIYPETSEKFLPHDLNLPALGAISFNKGCYTGQEIIARMQYRGKLKNHLYQATVRTPLSVARGADIYLEGKSSGNIVDFLQIENNYYELLVIARDNDVETNALTIDPDKKYFLEFSNHG
jgi:hypothetical protein